jgi:hypothetical protein
MISKVVELLGMIVEISPRASVPSKFISMLSSRRAVRDYGSME